MAQYDFIILGGGAAGLMLARAMADDPWFKSSQILIVEKEVKNQNDRTWCFWEEASGAYDHILSHRWDQIVFKGTEIDRKLDILPYRYKMIRSRDFYDEQMKSIEDAPNIEFLQASILEINETDDCVSVSTSVKTVTATRAFNSLFEYKSILSQEVFPVLQQHFIGWFIETDKPVFDHTAATFMDFSVPQKGNTRFMYVLPLSPSRALVEYTLFSAEPLPAQEYEEAINDYLELHYGEAGYTILEREKGNIPMTCFNFESRNTERILHIGTAGGWAKPSTGFTFKNSMKNTQKLIGHLKRGKAFRRFSVKSRYWFYDLLLLDILHKNNELGSTIFESMFKNRSPQVILRFLDEKCRWYQDLWVITACPVWPFTKALLSRIFK